MKIADALTFKTDLLQAALQAARVAGLNEMNLLRLASSLAQELDGAAFFIPADTCPVCNGAMGDDDDVTVVFVYPAWCGLPDGVEPPAEHVPVLVVGGAVHDLCLQEAGDVATGISVYGAAKADEKIVVQASLPPDFIGGARA